jgi:hypothetical protein
MVECLKKIERERKTGEIARRMYIGKYERECFSPKRKEILDRDIRECHSDKRMA